MLTRVPLKEKRELRVKGQDLDHVSPDVDKQLRPAVSLSLKKDAQDRMADLTKQSGRYLAVILDGKVIMAPAVNDQIRHRVLLSLGDRAKEANTLVQLLRSAALSGNLSPRPVLEYAIRPRLPK